jgi:hypothetical protein
LKRFWFSLALLSASWLFGLSYYHQAQPWVWAILIAAGTALLIGIQTRRPAAFEAVIAGIALLVAVRLAPWPYRIAPLLLFAAVILFTVPVPRRWPGVLASALFVSGSILTVQTPVLLAYKYVTSVSHELVQPVSYLVYLFSRLLGIHSALNGSNLAMYTPRAVHLLGMTWELFLDPATLSFLAGGFVLLFFCKSDEGSNRFSLVKRLSAFVLVIVAWLPVRAAVLIAIFLHRALRTEYDANLSLVTQFWNQWLLAAFLLVPVLLALRFIRLSPAGSSQVLEDVSEIPHSRLMKFIALAFAGSFLLVTALFLDMPGHSKGGRVFVEEFHSDWERTDRPFDTQWYGQDSGYNYACIYDYLTRFYEMSRLEAATSDASLGNCNVLIVKVPTKRYTPQEVSAIESFVRRGGGLMLVGEHTSVFNSGTYINDIAQLFGFRFNYDCLFGIDTTFEELYKLPLVPHPIIQNMPPLNFAVSCSIDPGPRFCLSTERRGGRAVIRSTGLKNLPADYHASNFYPQVENRAIMRYGAFVQLWTCRYGKGRVVAFTDSTVFSNFATFEPGKAELMLGMVNWLNRSNAGFNPGVLFVVLSILAFAGALLFARDQKGIWLTAVAVVFFGWAVAVVTVQAVHKYSMPPPAAKRPMVNVTIDRTVCDAPLSTSGFISGDKNGFGIFERWILRLGYFTSRKKGTEALTGDLVVFTQPDLTVESKFREELVSYVTNGGHILVLDSPANTKSTANSLLYPFGISVNRSTQRSGQLRAPQNWPVMKIDSAYQIEGGEPFLWADNFPVAARKTFGKGTVTVIGFGSRFADAYMGVTGDVVPSDELKKVFDLQFAILKDIVAQR